MVLMNDSWKIPQSRRVLSSVCTDWVAHVPKINVVHAAPQPPPSLHSASVPGVPEGPRNPHNHGGFYSETVFSSNPVFSSGIRIQWAGQAVVMNEGPLLYRHGG